MQQEEQFATLTTDANKGKILLGFGQILNKSKFQLWEMHEQIRQAEAMQAQQQAEMQAQLGGINGGPSNPQGAPGQGPGQVQNPEAQKKQLEQLARNSTGAKGISEFEKGESGDSA